MRRLVAVARTPMALALLVYTAVVFLFAVTVTFGQDAAAEPMPDPKMAAALAIAQLTPVVTMFVVWGAKLLWQKVPASLVLMAGPLLGIVVNFGLSWLTSNTPADPLAAAALGAVATWVREVGATLVSKGVAGSVTPTKGML